MLYKRYAYTVARERFLNRAGVGR